MKYRTVLATIAASLGLACVAFGENLTVGPTETINISSSVTYDTITVRGTLNVSDGAVVGATTVNLGPEAGDTAVVTVDGDSTRFGSTTTEIIVGANGGTGKLVAPANGSPHTGMWDQIWAFAFKTLTVSANAAVGGDGYIDVLDLKHSATPGGKIANEHATGIVRVTADGHIRFGGNQYYGGTFFSGKVEIDQKAAGKTVYFCPRYAPMTLAPASAELTFRNVDAICVQGIGDDSTQGKVTINGGVSWLGRCDLRVEGSKSGFVMGSNDVLPYGVGKGALRIDASSGWVNLNATTQHLNGLEAVGGRSAAAGYAVVGSAGSKLVFGSGDVDGSLSGAISPTIVVEKTGAGVLTVSNAVSLGSMTVSSGTLHVKATAQFAALSVAEDATLIVDGVTLSVPAESSAITGACECVNGGRLLTEAKAEVNSRLSGFSAKGVLSKTGAGALTLENPVSMPSEVSVQAGTLAFSGRGYAIPLYRFSSTKWYGGHFSFYRFALVDSAGARACTGLVYKATGTAASELKPGEVTVPTGYVDTYSYWKADCMFLTDTGAGRMDISSPALGDEGVEDMSFTFAPPADSQPGVAYNWSPCWAGHPVTWRLLASFDGGANWTEVDAQTNFRDWYLTDKNWVDGTSDQQVVPPAFPMFCADPRAATPVASGMPATMQLEVAAGARADFGSVTGGQLVDGLTVSTAGAGSVSNVVFAATGTLKVIAAGALPAASVVELPLMLEGVSGTANLERWNVLWNGNKTSRIASVKDGKILLAKSGMVLIFR